MIDPATAKVLIQLGTYGPLGIMVVLLFVLLLRQQKECRELRLENAVALNEERSKNQDLTDKLVLLTENLYRADGENTELMREMIKVLDRVDRRLE